MAAAIAAGDKREENVLRAMLTVHNATRRDVTTRKRPDGLSRRAAKRQRAADAQRAPAPLPIRRERAPARPPIRREDVARLMTERRAVNVGDPSPTPGWY